MTAGEPLAGVFGLRDFEAAARAASTPAAYAYLAGGAGDEVTMGRNVASFRERRLRPRVMRDVSSVDASATLLGTPVSLPAGLAPVAQQGLAHPEGEVAVARAARAANVLMCLSTLSTRSLEEVAAVGDAPRWFQLYLHRDRGVSRDLVRRACAAGYRAIVVTADLPYPGYREREMRDPVVHEGRFPFGNFEGSAGRASSLTSLLNEVVDSSVTWADLAWIRDVAGVPVLVKGVLTGEDARIAVESGAAGVVVSNHGGRQLDRTPATVDVLEEVAAAAGEAAEVYLDGGVRRGVDVVTALALGAAGVFVGRPYVFALAAAGTEGVSRALEILSLEIHNALGLLGARNVDEVTRDHVV
jgi:isopentenyl diphosphate isomerase/L-lactate dehydrogenase-like FMN-dependent dehydrogenase